MPSVQKNESGGSGRSRRGRGARVSSSLSEINVVPLVDVMLVLLIIFMVTAPMMQQGLAVNLPKAQKASPVRAQPIYVTLAADFSRTQRVQIDKASVPIEFLAERMRQAMQERDEKSVFIRSDAGASMQDFTAVMDKLKEAGVEKVGFMTQPLNK
jgi:biopolymer transport protein TolR